MEINNFRIIYTQIKRAAKKRSLCLLYVLFFMFSFLYFLAFCITNHKSCTYCHNNFMSDKVMFPFNVIGIKNIYTLQNIKIMYFQDSIIFKWRSVKNHFNRYPYFYQEIDITFPMNRTSSLFLS